MAMTVVTVQTGNGFAPSAGSRYTTTMRNPYIQWKGLLVTGQDRYNIAIYIVRDYRRY